MEITLSRATIDNAQELHAMQVESFKELLEKYQDFDTNPGNESMEKVAARLKQDFTFYYFICIGQKKAGAIRIVDFKEDGKTKEFPPYLSCRNFKGKASHRKQSGCVKKYMEMKIGSWTQFCRKLKTVICMKKWDIAGRAKQKSLMKDLH